VSVADFVWPDVTIGNTIDAVRFAIKNKTCLLLSGFPVVGSYELLPGLKISREEVWAEAVYQAYNMSLVPFSDKIKSIRISDNRIQVFTKTEKKYTIYYENINLFSLNNVSGLESDFDKVFCYNKVIDWFDVRSGGEESFDFDIPPDSVIQSIDCYPSKRLDGQRYYDVYSVSYLSDAQLTSYEYSDTYIRFMIQKYAKLTNKEINLELWKRDVGKVYEIVFKQINENIKWLGDACEIH
jgi:sporulation protein YlmC with PRC-barrel domain